jgi:hypothetical protein
MGNGWQMHWWKLDLSILLVELNEPKKKSSATERNRTRFLDTSRNPAKRLSKDSFIQSWGIPCGMINHDIQLVRSFNPLKKYWSQFGSSHVGLKMMIYMLICIYVILS